MQQPRLLTADQVVAAMGGTVSAHALRKAARAGKVPGATRILGRVWFDRRTPRWLTQDLSTPDVRLNVQTPAADAIGWHSRRGHTTLDGQMVG